jgi:deoxyadenosine/deoxycytidine kinase
MSVKDGAGKSLLDYFYADKARWSYTFQTCAFLTRIMDTEKVLDSLRGSESKEGKDVIVITERSVLTDRYVFAAMLYKAGSMTDLEYDLYLRWYDRYAAGLPMRGIIHLETPPDVSLARIGVRGRDAESGIGLDYLEALESQHRTWLSSTELPVFRLASNDGSLEALKTWVRGIVDGQA